MVANIVEKMMVAFWLCTELSTTFVDNGRFLYLQGHVENLVASLRSCMALHPADFRSWLIIFGLTADGTAPMATDARWVSGSDAAFDRGCVKTPALRLLVENVSQFRQSEK